MKIHPIIRTLNTAFPQASFEIIQSRDWCSMTFAGQQLTICCSMSGPGSAMSAKCMVEALPETEFSIPGLLVADIVVVAERVSDDGVKLTIEALVINE